VHQPLHLIWLAPALALLAMASDARDVLGTVVADASFVAAHCPVEALVVMGAAQYDGRPSPAFERRLDGALDLFRRGCAPTIVVSGGRREGDRVSEGAAGVAYLAARGVPASALVAEEEARTSVENVRNAAALVGDARLVIVTDDLHAHRSESIARRLGVQAVAAPVRAEGDRMRYAAREVLALLAYRVGAFR
jgi:uncharacterized SAM-binding protein YcdF (DUF218 family)